MALIGYGRFVHFYLSDQGYNVNLLSCKFIKVVFLTENDFQIVLIHILCRGFFYFKLGILTGMKVIVAATLVLSFKGPVTRC